MFSVKSKHCNAAELLVDEGKRKEFMGELEKKKNENYGMVCRNFAEIKKCNRSDDRYQSGSISPSHRIVLGADPIAAARALKGCIFHVQRY